ncbi:hypothetical protein Lal_00022492 [Lupinus albus]|nr:hypothetical protein Lal_00022492 [Lupinus albus]
MAEFHSYIELFLIWLLSTILVRAILTRKWKKYVSAPSPIALPIIGHLHLISHLPHQNRYHHLKLYPGDENNYMSTKKLVVVECYDEMVSLNHPKLS